VDILRSELIPAIARSGADSIALAACIHCAGEYTVMADWPDAETVGQAEADRTYLAARGRLEPVLRVPPKRELWERLPVE
jgi:hypothetical protein